MNKHLSYPGAVKSNNLDKKIGKIFNKYIKTGTPEIKGYYLCYIEPKIKGIEFPTSIMNILKFEEGNWVYTFANDIIAWIGPLPNPTVEELKSLYYSEEPKQDKQDKEDKEDKELIKVKYAVGKIKNAAYDGFNHGPFDHLSEAFGVVADKGDVMWEINEKETIPVFYWRKGWAQVSAKRYRKIMQMIERLKKT